MRYRETGEVHIDFHRSTNGTITYLRTRHCMGWIRPVMDAAGLYAVMDMESCTEPHCVFRVYVDPEKAKEYKRQAKLPSLPLVPMAERTP